MKEQENNISFNTESKMISWEDDFVEAQKERFRNTIFSVFRQENIFEEILNLGEKDFENLNSDRYLESEKKFDYQDKKSLFPSSVPIVDITSIISKHFDGIRFVATPDTFENVKEKLKKDLFPVAEKIVEEQYKSSIQRVKSMGHRWADYYSSGDEISSVYNYRPYFGDLLERGHFEKQKSSLAQALVHQYIEACDPRTKEEKTMS